MAKKIVCTSDTCSGSPRIEDTRLTCANITIALHFSMDIKTYLANYPYLCEEDIRACLEYCAGEKCLDDKPDNFCEGCTHDKRQEEKPSYFINGKSELDKYMKSAGQIKGYAFLGSEEEYEEECLPHNLWEYAKECLNNLVT